MDLLELELELELNAAYLPTCRSQGRDAIRTESQVAQVANDGHANTPGRLKSYCEIVIHLERPNEPNMSRYADCSWPT
jgi:hypothetical protein